MLVHISITHATCWQCYAQRFDWVGCHFSVCPQLLSLLWSVSQGPAYPWILCLCGRVDEIQLMGIMDRDWQFKMGKSLGSLPPSLSVWRAFRAVALIQASLCIHGPSSYLVTLASRLVTGLPPVFLPSQGWKRLPADVRVSHCFLLGCLLYHWWQDVMGRVSQQWPRASDAGFPTESLLRSSSAW